MLNMFHAASMTLAISACAWGQFYDVIPGPVVTWNSIDVTPPGNFVQVSAGREVLAAIREDGNLLVWDFDIPAPGSGQNHVAASMTAMPVELVNAVAGGACVTDVSVGYFHMMALLDNNKAFSWGSIVYPLHDFVPEFDFVDITAGENVSAGITTDGRLVIWGTDYNSLWDSWDGVDLMFMPTGTNPTNCDDGMFVSDAGLYTSVECSGHHVLATTVAGVIPIEGWGPAQKTGSQGGCVGCTVTSSKYIQRMHIFPVANMSLGSVCSPSGPNRHDVWPGGNDVIQISAGHTHSAALFEDAEFGYPALFAWGHNAGSPGCSDWEGRHYLCVSAGEQVTVGVKPNHQYEVFGGPPAGSAGILTNATADYAEAVSARYAAGMLIQRCFADFDRDGQITAEDLTAYLAALAASDPAADTDGVDGLTVFDALAFINLYHAGCPWYQ